MVKKFYIETYGCQMNVADSEVVAAILTAAGFEHTTDKNEADVILVNTCSVRENAEQRVRGRVQGFSEIRKRNPHLLVGVMGCMAERLGERLFEEEKNVNIVVGPDAYMDLPLLIEQASQGKKAINIELSTTETYKDICPSRIDETAISGFVSIMRGCNNFCTYCIVPYVRGRERSRRKSDILREIEELAASGVREITLLGQNVNSYGKDLLENEGCGSFAELLSAICEDTAGSGLRRIRFMTSHPKDLSEELIEVMAKYPAVCDQLHLPVQSGSTEILRRMNRRYTKEQYLSLVGKIRARIPQITLSTDIITGFPGESEEDFMETLDLVRKIRFDMAYTFIYSPRVGTPAAADPHPVEADRVKDRFNRLLELQNTISREENEACVGKTFEVLWAQSHEFHAFYRKNRRQ